jgi:hypothetical protein
VRFVVKPPTSQDGNLIARILRVSDSVAFGGLFSITADQVRALPEIAGSGGFRYVEGFLDSAATLATATQYEGKLLATTTSADPWTVIMMSAVGAGGQSYGGTTDFARLGTIAAGSSLTEQDLTLMFLEQPAAPATATAQIRQQPQDGDGCWCSVRYVDQVEVDWAATNITSSFSRYEIERETDDGAGFVPVWTVTTEATSIWWDYEMPMDRASRYRVRVVSIASAFSAWTYTDWVTPSSYGNEVVFTSNHAPQLQLVYERTPEVEFGFLDHQSDETVRIYGADYQVAFFDPNDRGVTQSLDLVVQFGREPSDNLARPLNMEAVFGPLRDLSRSTLIPYVCVRHRNGSVLYAGITLSAGRVVQPGNRWTVTALATPLTGPPIAGTSV